MCPPLAATPPGIGAPFSMSNASIQTHEPDVFGPRSCVTSIVSVWAPDDRPWRLKITLWYFVTFAKVSTTVLAPSSVTVARPDQPSSTPIHEMPVPVKLNVRLAPRVLVSAADPLLLLALMFEYQLPA